MRRRVCETQAVRQAGLLDWEQAFTISCVDWDPLKLAYRIKGALRNWGLVVVVFKEEEELYVGRPSPSDPSRGLPRNFLCIHALLGVLVAGGMDAQGLIKPMTLEAFLRIEKVKRRLLVNCPSTEAGLAKAARKLAPMIEDRQRKMNILVSLGFKEDAVRNLYDMPLRENDHA